jgi:Amt family ammonium transporter
MPMSIVFVFMYITETAAITPAAAGVVAAVTIMYLKTRTIDIGMAGNGAIAGLVGITAPSGYVEYWAAPIIGAIAGVIVVYGIVAIEKVIDDPVGATSAHGLAGIWGTLSCGIFTSPRLAEFNEVGDPGLWYSGSFSQLGAQALGVAVAFGCVFAVSYSLFWLIKKTIGLRVSAEEEDAGLDISEHGMYGYPEQFIPQPESWLRSRRSTRSRRPSTSAWPATARSPVWSRSPLPPATSSSGRRR